MSSTKIQSAELRNKTLYGNAVYTVTVLPSLFHGCETWTCAAQCQKNWNSGEAVSDIDSGYTLLVPIEVKVKKSASELKSPTFVKYVVRVLRMYDTSS